MSHFNCYPNAGIESRLVILPHERHSYQARESILHMAWEQEEWLKSLEHEYDTGVTAAEVDGCTGQSDGVTTDAVAATNVVIEGGDGGDKGEAISVVITEGGSNANNAKAFVAAAQVDEIAGAEAD